MRLYWSRGQRYCSTQRCLLGWLSKDTRRRRLSRPYWLPTCVCVCVWLSIPWVTKPFPQAGAILHGTASGCSYSLKRRPLNVELIIEQNNQKIKREKPPTLAHTGLRHVHTRAHTHTTCLHPLSENKNIPDSLVTVPKHT